MSFISLRDILSKHPEARRAGDDWLIQCPVHPDLNPSLSVTEGEGGRLLVHCHAGCPQDEVRQALEFECEGKSIRATSIKYQGAGSNSNPVAKANREGKANKLWKNLEEADSAFAKLELVRFDEEGQRFFREEYGLEPADLPDSWCIFDHPNPKLGRGAVYRGEAPDGSPVYKFKSFARNDKGKRECRFLYGSGGMQVFDRPGAPMVLVGGEEKALAAHCSGAAAVALLTGEKAPSEAIIKSILSLGPPRIVLANDNDVPGEKANTETAAALERAGYPASKIAIMQWSVGAPPGYDVNDVLIGGSIDALRQMIENARSHSSILIPQTITAAALDGKEYPEQRQIIYQIRPEGQTVLASRPKKGKSWLELGFAIAVALGIPALGVFETTQGDVLYLALEDSERRIKSRLQVLLGEKPKPERLHFATQWPRLDLGGLEALRQWLVEHPGAVMIVIDTFTRVRPPKPPGADPYQADSEATAALQRLALEFHVAIVLIMHQRKSGSEDVFDTINGTLGLTASADAVVILSRENGSEGRLSLTGRDIEERTLALSFESGIWKFLGEADESEEPDHLDEAQAFLREILKDGPVESTEIFSQGQKVKISRNKLYDACKALGIKPKKNGLTGKWSWALPAKDSGKSGELGKLGKLGNFANFGEDRDDGENSDDEEYCDPDSNFPNSPNFPNLLKIPNSPELDDFPEDEPEVRL